MPGERGRILHHLLHNNPVPQDRPTITAAALVADAIMAPHPTDG
jgi:hypothetical protein